MQAVKRDVSSVEAAYESLGLLLCQCSHAFQSISLKGFRRHKRGANSVTAKTPVDGYLNHPPSDKSSLHEFICKGNKVPVINDCTTASYPLYGLINFLIFLIVNIALSL